MTRESRETGCRYAVSVSRVSGTSVPPITLGTCGSERIASVPPSELRGRSLESSCRSQDSACTDATTAVWFDAWRTHSAVASIWDALAAAGVPVPLIHPFQSRMSRFESNSHRRRERTQIVDDSETDDVDVRVRYGSGRRVEPGKRGPVVEHAVDPNRIRRARVFRDEEDRHEQQGDGHKRNEIEFPTGVAHHPTQAGGMETRGSSPAEAVR